MLSAAAVAKSLQSCPTLCDPIDSSPPGSRIPGILQARTLELVAISFSNAWKWKVKVKSLSCVRLLATPWTAAYQAPRSMGFARQEYWSGLPLPSPSLLCTPVQTLHNKVRCVFLLPLPPQKKEREKEKSNYLRASSVSFPRTQSASFWSLPWIPYGYYRSPIATVVANDLILTELEGGLVFILKSLPFQSAFQWMFERHFVTNLYHSTRNAHSQIRLGLPC